MHFSYSHVIIGGRQWMQYSTARPWILIPYVGTLAAIRVNSFELKLRYYLIEA